MITVREIPDGSGIHGRPVLDDKRRHIAYFDSVHDKVWVTHCGLRVPDDHLCPSYVEIMDHPSEYLTCWPCDFAWRKREGEWVPV